MFWGTIIIGSPIALLIGMKREAIGATFSIDREPNLAIISEKYGSRFTRRTRGIRRIHMRDSVRSYLFSDPCWIFRKPRYFPSDLTGDGSWSWLGKYDGSSVWSTSGNISK